MGELVLLNKVIKMQKMMKNGIIIKIVENYFVDIKQSQKNIASTENNPWENL